MSAAVPQQAAVADTFDTFTHMLIEDFLMRKGMDQTLASFRDEWHRPDEVMPE
jgi:hypothetical protein